MHIPFQSDSEEDAVITFEEVTDPVADANAVTVSECHEKKAASLDLTRRVPTNSIDRAIYWWNLAMEH